MPFVDGVDDAEVVVSVGAVDLPGHLSIPSRARGLILFAHGSGSSRHSPRNQRVAEVLNRAGFATLLFDLLTSDEERERANVFDIALLGRRLVDVTRWARSTPATADLSIGYFGASTGAGAALWAAAEPGSDTFAVVGRGGRPDLAGAGRLAAVRAPTLLIVGSNDEQVLLLNQSAALQLRCEHAVAVVSGASHLFEEPGTLDAAAELAREWYVAHAG